MKTNKTRRGFRIAAAVFLVACCGLEIPGKCQSSTTDLEGLSIEAGAVYHSRDSNSPHCLLNLKLLGRRISPDAKASIIETTRIADDTGSLLDPVKEDWERYEGLNQTIALKCPAPRAKYIEVEGKAKLLTPTIPQLVFSNLETHTEQALKHPLLQKNHIVIRVLQPQSSSRGVDIETEDPDNQLLCVGFPVEEGIMTGQDRFQFGLKKTTAFKFLDAERLGDLKLIVRLKAPLKAEPFGFKITNIPLRWLQPPRMEVTVKEMKETKLKWLTNSYGCAINLNFKGGPLTNAFGIYRVWITRAESEPGQKFEVKSQMFGGGLYEHDAGLDELTKRTELDRGGSVTKVLCLFTKLPRPKSISILEGDAEVFSPTVENGGFVCFTNQLTTIGEMAVMSPLKENGVTIKFLGFQNFYSKKKELEQMPGSRYFINASDSGPPPITTKDSLLFSFDDPQDVILSSHNEFYDAFGKQTLPISWVEVAGHCLVGGFDSLPVRTRFSLHVATPQSMERVHFKIENVPLP